MFEMKASHMSNRWSSHTWLLRIMLRTRSQWRLLTRATWIGLALSVMACVVTFAIVNGFENAFRDGLLAFQAPLVVVDEAETSDLRAVADVVRSQLDVAHAPHIEPFLFREGLMTSASGIERAIVRGVTLESLHAHYRAVLTPNSDLDAWEESASSTQHDVQNDPLPVIMGDALGKRFQGNAVDTVQLMVLSTSTAKSSSSSSSPTENSANSSRSDQLVTTTIPLRIVGTLHTGVEEYDAHAMLAFDRALAARINVHEQRTGLDVWLRDPANAALAAEALQPALPAGVTATPWQELHRDTADAMQMERLLFGVVMAIVALLAAVNLLASVSLHILEQHRSLALMSVLGLAPKRLQRLIAARGAAWGASAIVIGLACGALASVTVERGHWLTLDASVYFIDHVPAHLTLTAFLSIACTGLACCTLAVTRASRTVRALPLLDALGKGYV